MQVKPQEDVSSKRIQANRNSRNALFAQEIVDFLRRHRFGQLRKDPFCRAITPADGTLVCQMGITPKYRRNPDGYGIGNGGYFPNKTPRPPIVPVQICGDQLPRQSTGANHRFPLPTVTGNLQSEKCFPPPALPKNSSSFAEAAFRGVLPIPILPLIATHSK